MTSDVEDVFEVVDRWTLIRTPGRMLEHLRRGPRLSNKEELPTLRGIHLLSRRNRTDAASSPVNRSLMNGVSLWQAIYWQALVRESHLAEKAARQPLVNPDTPKLSEILKYRHNLDVSFRHAEKS